MPFDHWTRAVDTARVRPSEERDGASRPSQAHFGSISGLTEKGTATDFGGGRPVGITHPAMGVRAWIRFIPEEGSSAVLTQRSDTGEPEILYYSGSRASTKIDAYLRGIGHYRPLDLGEVEISSSGLAQTFWSRRGGLYMRGGTTQGWLVNDDQEVGFKAATHRRLLHDYSHDRVLSGEERFGLVWRKGDNHTKRKYIKKDGDFAREYVRAISFEGSPTDLVVYREGHVYDEDGEPVTSPIGSHLRVSGRWYNADGNGYLSHEVDDSGNVWWTTPNTATTGWTMHVPKGTYRLKAAEKIQLGAGSDVEFSGQNMTIHARGILTLKSNVAINIDGGPAVAIQGASVTIKGRVVTDSKTVV
jgi:hypothetical protein